MKRFNICTKKVYTKDGVEKAFWPSVGTLTYFPPSGEKQGGFRLELPIFGNTQFYVFEQKPKEAPAKPAADPLDTAYPQDAINPDDIPF